MDYDKIKRKEKMGQNKGKQDIECMVMQQKRGSTGRKGTHMANRRAVVLAGGGSRGAYQGGVWRAMRE